MRRQAAIMGRAVDFDEVDVDEALRLQVEGATIIDVRTDEERAEKRIAGSIHIPITELEARMSEVPDGKVVFACKVGARSAVAADMVEKATGRTDVSSVAGGTDRWEAEGKPIDR